MVKSVIDYYSTYDEDGRLFRDNSHQIEWLTTMHYFDAIIPADSKIFDGCAGTGNYAFRLAEQGHHVTVSDVVPHNVDIMLKKQERTPLLKDIFAADLCVPNHCDDHYYDVVLCMGAFYHLDEGMRDRAMEQCLRLLKDGGLLVVTYINLITVLQLNLMPCLENIGEIVRCYGTKSMGDSFVYMMPEEMEAMAEKYNLTILHHITSDGNPLLRGADFDKARKEDFEKYMAFHLQICETKSMVGSGLHGLVFLTNK